MLYEVITLVDGPRHDRPADVNTVQAAVLDQQIGHRLAADIALIDQLDRAAHVAEDIENAAAGRVDADIADQQFTAGYDQSGDQKESRRGDT